MRQQIIRFGLAFFFLVITGYFSSRAAALDEVGSSSVTAHPKTIDTGQAHPFFQVLPGIKRSLNRYPSYFVFIFIGALAMLALIRLIVPSYLREILTSIVSLKLLLNLFQEGKFGFSITNLLLDILAIAMYAVIIHQLWFAQRPELFGWIVMFTAIGYFLKLIIIQLFANIFFGRGEALVHLLMHLLFTRISGLILLPVLFVGLYQSYVGSAQFLGWIVILLACCYLLWVFRLFTKMKSVSISGIFYIFLYLCTVELSPLCILLKYIIQDK